MGPQQAQASGAGAVVGGTGGGVEAVGGGYVAGCRDVGLLRPSQEQDTSRIVYDEKELLY